MAKRNIKKTDKSEPTIEDTFKKMDPHKHVLELPDTYIGAIEEDKATMWIYDEISDQIVNKEIKYIPGLYKIFDEIVVNARDHTVRDTTCSVIKINISKDTGKISCFNNGKGNKSIPVEIHKEHNMYVPEMIFGNLHTSGNYYEKGKTVGGKNGFGAKLANIFSTHFYIEIVDSKRKLKYTQNYYDNMYTKEDPKITKLKECGDSSTLISFIPDFKKFGVDGLSDDMIALFKKRVYDIAACTNHKVKVYLNDKQISVSTFEDYVKKFYGEIIPSQIVYEQIGDRWKVATVYDPSSGYRQISYVNGICTFQGGTHVNHVSEQIITKLCDFIKDKHKNVKIKNSHIKENLTLFIDSVIEDPSFSSQTKETLTTKVTSFGSKCEISDKFIKELSKTGIVEEVVNFAKLKEMAELKKTDGKKTNALKGLHKLDDAKWAGTRKSKECRLILTEGDSAKNFAVAGVEIIGREKFGIFPLKGKLENVRNATPNQLLKNEEIKNIKQILGLKQGKVYKDVSQLRYGGIIILTDQDVDGSHIKGLLINFIHFFWPSLLKINGFIQSMATPILKVWKVSDVKKKNVLTFYSLSKFEEWRESLGSGSLKKKGWKVKYYKGLGTSDDVEAKEAFNDFETKLITYIWDQNSDQDGNNKLIEENDSSDIENEEDSQSVCSSKDKNDIEEEDYDKSNPCWNAITLAFSKNRADDRKSWLYNYNPKNFIENTVKKITYYDFVHKDLIHFSNYDNIRSIPSVCDGFKPSQRKILYGAMLRKIYKEEIKVAQLAGFVSDKAAYHHGEMSLQQTIVGMAQNFTGSNNLNILKPNGQFGNRRAGGKNYASARYIFTQLNELVPTIFKKDDENVYTYTDDDGKKVEPVSYAPIVPLILINGTSGIGTGFSTDIPCFNPLDVINNIKHMLNGEQIEAMSPWYRGFKGKMIKVDNTTYTSYGIIEALDENTVHITELPIGTWIEPYFAFLDSISADDPKNIKKGQLIKSYTHDCGNNSVNITVTLLDGVLQELIKKDSLIKEFKLSKNIRCSNMYLHDPDSHMKKYDTIESILIDYYKFRLDIYVKRKAYKIKLLKNELDIIEWKVKFLEYVISGKIKIFENKKARKKSAIIEDLEKLGFPKLCTTVYNIEPSTIINDDDDNDEQIEIVDNKSYSYIFTIYFLSITEEELDKLKKEYEEKLAEYKEYVNIKVEQLWANELEEFENAYEKWFAENSDLDDNKSKKKKKIDKSKKNVEKKKKAIK